MKQKVLLSSLLICIVGFLGIWYYAFYKPTHFRRNVADEQGVTISAAALVKAYQANEQAANLSYLDKPLEITGEITEVKQDQTGKTTLTLKSEDAFAGVFCTIISADHNFKTGQLVTVKGICTGFLTDVVLKDAIVMK